MKMEEAVAMRMAARARWTETVVEKAARNMKSEVGFPAVGQEETQEEKLAAYSSPGEA